MECATILPWASSGPVKVNFDIVVGATHTLERRGGGGGKRGGKKGKGQKGRGDERTST